MILFSLCTIWLIFSFRAKSNQQSFAASLIQVGGNPNSVRPFAEVDYEGQDAQQPLYQEPFAALNNADENDMTNYARQNNTQEDLIVQHQQQQQLLMMQGVSMALDNKGNGCNKSDWI